MTVMEPNFNFPALNDAQGKLDAARKRMKQIFDEAGPEMDMTKVKCVPAADALSTIRTSNEELGGLKKKVEELRDVARAKAAMGLFEGGSENGDGANTKDRQGSTKSLGESIGDRLSDLRKNKERVYTLENVDLKADFTRSAGWAPESVRSGRVELTPLRPAQYVVNYIPIGTTSQAAYKYMEETTHTATNVVETAEAGTFGEAALALTERSKTVEKIPGWIPVTDEQLEDEPAARDYLENRLVAMVQRRLDAQVLVGDGNTPNLMGTENVVGIQTQALGVDTLMDASFKLFTLIRSDGFAEPSVAYVAPTKWQNVVLAKTADGQYIWGHPANNGPESLWGVPIVQTTAHTSTKLVAGDYATYSMLFIRRGIDVQITNSHASFFISGKQALRADMRAVMVHFRPKAFGTVTGL